MTASLLLFGLFACGTDTETQQQLVKVQAKLNDLQHVVEFQQQSIDALRGRIDASEEPREEAADITLNVGRVAPGHVTLNRPELDQLFSSASSLGRMLEHKSGDGTVDGFTLHGVRSGSPLARLGLSNGDVMKAVNDHPLLSVSDGIAAYEALHGANNIVVQFVRHGRPSMLTIDVIDAT
jgi:S1-C subfamily serine protease